MGSGKGQAKRTKNITIERLSNNSITLTNHGQEMLDYIKQLGNVPVEDREMLVSWANLYNKIPHTEDSLDAGSAIAAYAIAHKKGLSGETEIYGDKINNVLKGLRKAWNENNFDKLRGIRISAEYYAMGYLTENYPELEHVINEKTNELQNFHKNNLNNLLGEDVIRNHSLYVIPNDEHHDPIINYLRKSYLEGARLPDGTTDGNVCTATFVPQKNAAAGPIIITENWPSLMSEESVSHALIHESIHIANKHWTRASLVQHDIIEGTTDVLSFFAMEQDGIFPHLRSGGPLSYNEEMKFSLALANLKEPQSREELAKTIYDLSIVCGSQNDFTEPKSNVRINDWLGLDSDKKTGFNWSKFYFKNIKDNNLSVDEITTLLEKELNLENNKRKNISQLVR